MSSYASINVRGAEVFTWRNEIDPVFLFLFTSQDVHRTPRLPDGGYYSVETRLTVSADVLRDRLKVLGISREVVEARFNKLRDYRLQMGRELHRVTGVGKELIKLLDGITLSVWAENLTRAIEALRNDNRNDMSDPTSVYSLLDLWADADPRLLLAAVMQACGPDDEVTLDVSELVAGGWLYPDFDPQQSAIDHFSYSLAHGSPPVVITEGSTDAQFLQAAIRVRCPHLQPFIKFLDFTGGAEGSASAGVRTLKSFVAAGISNRVVLLLDNDTAARDALRALRGITLPSHYSILRYPDISLARNYPTIGPNGLSEMDVNGLAGSIELYLGIDVITGSDGQLSPVQWRSYIEGMKAYQGEVMHKADIQKQFREKIKAAEANPDLVGSQDWSGLDAILASLIELLGAPLSG